MQNLFVTLNVGGVRYDTSADTLRIYPGVLRRLSYEEQSEIFIDRNGKLFEFVLDYLRSGTLPVDATLLSRLRVEADFYALDAMVSDIDQVTSSIRPKEDALALIAEYLRVISVKASNL